MSQYSKSDQDRKLFDGKYNVLFSTPMRSETKAMDMVEEPEEGMVVPREGMFVPEGMIVRQGWRD